MFEVIKKKVQNRFDEMKSATSLFQVELGPDELFTAYWKLLRKSSDKSITAIVAEVFCGITAIS